MQNTLLYLRGPSYKIQACVEILSCQFCFFRSQNPENFKKNPSSCISGIPEIFRLYNLFHQILKRTHCLLTQCEKYKMVTFWKMLEIFRIDPEWSDMIPGATGIYFLSQSFTKDATLSIFDCIFKTHPESRKTRVDVS